MSKYDITISCGCNKNFLCKTAEGLWASANLIYNASGFDAWRDCKRLADYHKHRDQLYEREEEKFMKIKYAGDEWQLVRHPGYWMLVRPGVTISYNNDLSLEEFKKLLKEREKEEGGR